MSLSALAPLLALVPSALLSTPDGEDGPALAIERGDSGRIVVVRSAGSILADGLRFAQAIALSRVGDAPVCLIVGETLLPAQIDLLNRVSAAELVSVGAPPEALAPHVTREVDDVRELLEPTAEVVVSSLHIADVVEAAPEAYRRGVPLLLAGAELHDDLERLGVERACTVAARQPVALPDGIEREDLGDAAARWARVAAEEDAPYLAVANLFPGRSHWTGSPLGACLLAARHRGMLLALEENVAFHYAELSESESAPPGADDAAASWLRGSFSVGGSTALVAVPQVGVGPGVAGMMPTYGDPIVDLDGDEHLDAGSETVPIGTTCRLGGLDVSVSLRLIGAMGTTKFVDGRRTQRAVAVAPPAESIAARLVELYGGALPAALLLAGDHRELPFDYVKDPVYASTIMHEQELASDNLYADPDGDGYLDLAVGRFVASGLAQATTLASRLSSYSEWEDVPAAESALIYPAWAEDEAALGAPMVFASFEVALRGLGLDLERVGFVNHDHLREKGDLDLVYPRLSTSSLILFAHHSGPEGWVFRVEQKGGRRSADGLASPRNASVPKGTRVVPFLAGAPMIVGAGCDSAGLDFEVSLDESIVHAFFEQGALSYLGNTRAGFPDTEEFLIRQTLQGVLGLLPAQAEPLSIGEAFRNGKNFLDFLIRERGPFTSVEPFSDYAPPMRREWHSLVLYGDPAQRLRLPDERGSASVELDAWADEAPRIELRFAGEPEPASIWIPEEVGVGPIAEVTALLAPGLTYASVPWATFADCERPGPVGPGVYVELPLPDSIAAAPEVVLVEGPEWSLGGARVVRDARGERLVQLSVDFVRYAMSAPEEREVAARVVVELTGKGG